MAVIDVKTEITGNVWKVLVKDGDSVEEDQPIVILESMKMEIPISAPESGTVAEMMVEPEDIVKEGEVIARINV